MPEDMNYPALRFYWDILQSLALVVLFVWTAIDKKRQSNSAGIKDLKEEQNDLGQRVQRLEDHQSKMPTHKDMAQVKEQVARLSADIKAQNNLLQTIHRYLLDKKE